MRIFKDIQAPQPVSYHKCFVYQKQLIAVLGITDDLNNPTDVNTWNFDTKQWSTFNTTIDGKSRAVADLIGTDIVYIGGEEWNTHASGLVNSVYLNDKIYKNID